MNPPLYAILKFCTHKLFTTIILNHEAIQKSKHTSLLMKCTKSLSGSGNFVKITFRVMSSPVVRVAFSGDAQRESPFLSSASLENEVLRNNLHSLAAVSYLGNKNFYF